MEKGGVAGRPGPFLTLTSPSDSSSLEGLLVDSKEQEHLPKSNGDIAEGADWCLPTKGGLASPLGAENLKTMA